MGGPSSSSSRGRRFRRRRRVLFVFKRVFSGRHVILLKAFCHIILYTPTHSLLPCVGERDQKNEERERGRTRKKRKKYKTLNICKKKRVRGRGHIIEDIIRCAGDDAFLSLVRSLFLRRIRAPRRRCCGKECVCVCCVCVCACVCVFHFISNIIARPYDTAQTSSSGGADDSKNVRNDDERGVDDDAAFGRRPTTKRRTTSSSIYGSERRRRPSQKIVVWTVLALLSPGPRSRRDNITTTGARVDQHQHQQQRCLYRRCPRNGPRTWWPRCDGKREVDVVDDDAHEDGPFANVQLAERIREQQLGLRRAREERDVETLAGERRRDVYRVL